MNVQDAPPAVLAVRGLSKTFPGQRALDGLDLDVAAGSVHALVGENGSGKSTLIKIIAAYHQPDPGSRIQILGTSVDFPHDARVMRDLGVAILHQDSALAANLSVLENLALARGFARRRLGLIDWAAERRRARRDLDLVGLEVRPDTIVRDLGPTQATLVSIARALSMTSGGGKLLILDEPTAALPEHEIRTLFNFIRRFVKNGVGVLYVTHQLREVAELADTVTVLRNGRRVLTSPVSTTSVAEMTAAITGRPAEELGSSAGQAPLGQVRLEATGLAGRRVAGVSLEVREGEVLGVGGILGSGKSELGRLLLGAQKTTVGSVLVDGTPIRPHTPAEAIRRGVAYVSQNRVRDGSFANLTLLENLTITNMPDVGSRVRVSGRREEEFGRRLTERYGITRGRLWSPFWQLSGGNQQKAVIARWLARRPRIMIIDEPTQAVDVGSRSRIREQLRALADSGCAVLLISSDYQELAITCDRVIIMRNGVPVGTRHGARLTEDSLRLLAAGTPDGS